MALDPISPSVSRTEIRNVRLRGSSSVTTLRIEDGRFVAGDVDWRADSALDAEGCLVIPGLVEAHLHLDKAYLDSLLPGGSADLATAIRVTAEYKRTVTAADMQARASRAIEAAVLNGTTAMRVHTDVDPVIGLLGIEVILGLRTAYAALIDIQIVAFPQEGILQAPGTLALLREAIALGADVVGACPYNEKSLDDSHAHVDAVIALAAESGLDLDVHADFADDASDERFALASYIAAACERDGFAGHVTLGHVTSLGGIPRADRAAIIATLAAARVAVVTLPMTDAYLGGRTDVGPVRRGLTPVRELWAAGVAVACSTNNIRNAFTPYGRLDLLDTGLFLAQLAQLAGAEDLDRVLDSLTTVPAAILGLDGYGLSVGDRADLVIVDAPDVPTALLDRPARRWVFKAGQIVAESASSAQLRAAPVF